MVKTRVLVKALLVLTLSTLISACSGGGGGSGQGNGVINLSPTVTATVTVHIGTASLALNAPSTPVTATVLDASGNPIAGLQVTFSTTLGTLDPANGISVTDASGLASVQLTGGAVSGAGEVIASATVAGVKISKLVTFSVALPTINVATPVLGLASLVPGGSTSVTVSLTDASGAPFTTPVDVSFSSPFASSGKATLISPVRSVNGVASSTYTATGGVGTDVITVSVGANTGLPVTVTVAGAAANSISFVSASPTNITLKGMGGVGGAETSAVVFKVLDTNNQPKAGQTVDFSLNTSVGGLALTTTSSSSAADGTVSTTVKSGTVATPIRVTASIRDSSPVIATQSDQLVVSTGIPAQDGFSVSIGNMNPEAWKIDGVSTGITARLSDHFHNPVPDGTAVFFTTSGGSIKPSCVTTGGFCTVTWSSQNPRPTVALGAKRAGRAVILAYAVGEEFFLDLNGNGLADPTDTLGDDSEAFRDDNEDGVRQPTETFIDFGGGVNNQPDGIFNLPDHVYNGVLQGIAFQGAPKTKHVFSNSALVMASGDALITSSTNSIKAPGSFSVTVTDINGNTMPSGTTIAIASPIGILTGSISYTVPQNIGNGVTLPFFISASSNPSAQSGIVTVTVTSPGGIVTTKFIDISGSF
jgi:hypothetical protein